MVFTNAFRCALLAGAFVTAAAQAQSVSFFDTNNQPISFWRPGQTVKVKFSGGSGTKMMAIWMQSGQAGSRPDLRWWGSVRFPAGVTVTVTTPRYTNWVSLTGGYYDRYWPLGTLWRNGN